MILSVWPMAQKTIVVTGFGTFRDYKVNPSWEVARVLHTTGIIEELDINLITINIPVCYEDVDQIVPTLWSQHKPVVSCTLHICWYNYLSRYLYCNIICTF